MDRNKIQNALIPPYMYYSTIRDQVKRKNRILVKNFRLTPYATMLKYYC